MIMAVEFFSLSILVSGADMISGLYDTRKKIFLLADITILSRKRNTERG
jgi:hypothetical protein